ncbi:hypothetical protein M406DRAFT_80319 [Cryphonectria parasitica EP155]|uniref:Uncharacterized protein n=1 Tax=Cryphonectria parasitica (strain ATCC 38755 / EP155) TaxID=660469 RepID=A0A9P4Y6G2_CRYP1|nr:uncharacterized protein M406DRAFT_80319 [Cryphonectria parasitica EP155]KAF3767829.1 hypothetical protein M406DRAFT_80319 [Cryphonectria parasitica EP155]
MGAQHQPYMYSAARYDEDSRFPSRPFDPKAVTRASYDYKPPKPKQEGPLVSFNRHPDSHVVPETRNQFKALGPKTKWWIKWLRIAQLCIRVLQLVAAAGILFLFIVIDDVSALTAWVERITAGVTMIHCIYGIWHLARPAGSRPPASSASYQMFSAITDLAVLPLYTYGCLSVRSSSDHWGTLLKNESLMNYFLPALYYSLFGGAILHLISLCIGLWLALKFRQITRLPPDMNPLEDNLTSRHQKKLSIATTATYRTEHDRRLSTPLEDRRRSGLPYEDVDRPPSVPFYATRSSPRSSTASIDLPPRQYQVTPTHSPRNSVTAADLKRMSAPPPATAASGNPPTPPPRSPWRSSRASYAETGSSPPRPPKFTESWYMTESLFGRTHERNRAMKAKSETQVQGYEAIRRRYELSDSESDYEDENETATAYSVMNPGKDEMADDDGDLASPRNHPNPLRANPSLPSIVSTENNSDIGKPKPRMRPNTPFTHKSALSEIDLNDRRVSNGGAGAGAAGADDDVAEKKPRNYGGLKGRSPTKRYTWAPRDRDSSIQPESDFYAKPYGELKSATPPVMVGSDRQVSSGNDFGDLGAAGGAAAAKRYFSFGRRNVSGKIAEEGRGSPGIGRAR